MAIFRDRAQRCAVCRALFSLAGVDVSVFWADNDPYHCAVHVNKDSTPLFNDGDRILFSLALDIWLGRKEVSLIGALQGLDSDNLQAIGELVVALAGGPIAIDTWLQQRPVPEVPRVQKEQLYEIPF